MAAPTAAQEAELKQQGAFEAARDPTRPVSAADAEAKALTESQKAGVAAYAFDPDATPEQKAAQALSHVPADFHHKRKPVGIAVVTDQDDGKPSQYKLPSPTTAGAIEPVKDEKGDLIAGAQIGDQEKWIDRVGWAPKIGNGHELIDANEPSFMDHQSWLEGQLPEKFYGDWYHNTAVIIFACLSSWSVAAIGGGLGWVLIIMAACGSYYRTSLRRVRRNFRDDVGREMAKTKIENDVESLEWINGFMDKFWPIYAPVIADTVINSVDQVLSTATPAFLDSMRMRFFTLGSKPPRMEHVRSYPRAGDDTVLMDWKFSFTPNDTADMTAKQLKNKINPKVILEIRIGKAMVSKAMDIIVEDFAFSGLMRVKMKLQIPFPHIERVEVCFLEAPEIDYVCKPVGGEYLGFDINFIPGLQTFIKDQIHANIGPIMYAPNVFPIEVAKMLSGAPIDQAIGVVAITIHRAQGLKNTDKFSGTPDPYIALSLNRREVLAQTKIIRENANPIWNETKYIIVTSMHDDLTLQVFDYNDIRKDKELGVSTFQISKLSDKPEYDNEQLEVLSNGKPRGIIAADVRFFPVMESGTAEDGKPEPPPESNTGIARFSVTQAKDLDGSKSIIGQLNPYAVLLLNGKEIFISKKLKRTNNPIWSDAHKEILITDRKTAKLGLVIKDDRDLATDPILGTYQIKMDDMLKLMEKGQEWYNLAGATTGRAKMSLQWKPVAIVGSGVGTGGYVTPIGVMRIHIKNARGIRNLETMGKSDPYARVLLSGIEKARTVTHLNNLDPEFNEVLYVPMHTQKEKLTVELLDQEKVGKDRTLGEVTILAEDYIRQGESGEWLISEKHDLVEGLRMHAKGTAKGTLNYTVSFYPCLNIADAEDEEKAKTHSRKSSDQASQLSNGEDCAISAENKKLATVDGKANASELAALEEGEKEQTDMDTEEKVVPKIHLTPEELFKHDSGLIIFKLLDADLDAKDVHVEVLVDDMVFPSYSSAAARTKKLIFDETGDCFIRELEFSKLTIRLREKGDIKDDKSEKTIAKLTGNTMDTLRLCLNNPTVLKLKDDKGVVSSIKVSLKYIPVQMQLDPSESINNMGTLRVDIIDGADLPSADRNGYSDPFCKFELDDHTVFKTGVQKKTLHPVWNEFFETDIASRTAAKFRVRVLDWDFASDADLLGAADIDLSGLEPFRPQEMKLRLDGKSGVIRIRALFKPSYITRAKRGTSTFSGTFGVPGQIVTGLAGAPIKGVGLAAGGLGHVASFAGSGVGKGASFIKSGFSRKKDKTDSVPTISAEDVAQANGAGPVAVAPLIAVKSVEPRPVTREGNGNGFGDSLHVSHSRNRSNASVYSTGGSAPTGTASFTLVSAEGYPATANVTVVLKSLPKEKTVFKSRSLKAANGKVEFGDTFKTNCAADTQFQIQVLDHRIFGSDEVLGQGLAFVDETGSGMDKAVKVGAGTVVVRSAFEHKEGGAPGGGSPKMHRVTSGNVIKKSMFGKRVVSGQEETRGRMSVSRDGTPIRE